MIFSHAIQAALRRARRYDGKLCNDLRTMEGMSGRKYRLFINNLIESIPDPRYLEIGVWTGSTLCSAIYGNRVRAVGIDNWSEFGGSSKKALGNMLLFASPMCEAQLIAEDFHNVDFSGIGKFNIYLFDGPHTERDHYGGITLALPALDDEFVLVVDDWNWEVVRDGTMAAVKDAGLKISDTVIRTTADNSHGHPMGAASDWHNGYLIASCSKKN